MFENISYTFITSLSILTAIKTTAVYAVTRLVDTLCITWMLAILSIGQYTFCIMFEIYVLLVLLVSSFKSKTHYVFFNNNSSFSNIYCLCKNYSTSPVAVSMIIFHFADLLTHKTRSLKFCYVDNLSVSCKNVKGLGEMSVVTIFSNTREICYRIFNVIQSFRKKMHLKITSMKFNITMFEVYQFYSIRFVLRMQQHLLI